MRDRHLKLGALLTKPVTPASLAEACGVALDGRAPYAPALVDAGSALLAYHERLHGRRVPLAEDDEVNLELSMELLRRVGIEVVVARDGAQVLAMLHENQIDAVLMVCQMPGTNGFEATRRIRREPRWHDLPVIAMTANAMAGDREAAIAAGMNDHIAKPVDFDKRPSRAGRTGTGAC